MNPEKIRALFARNKVALGVLGAAAVAALAWRARSAKGADVASSEGTSSGGAWTAAPGATSTTGGYTAGYSGAYDSTASDIYNALQPQLEAVQTLLEQRQNATADPTVQGYFRRPGTNPVYQAMDDGTLRWVDKAEYLSLGSPKVTEVGASDPLWSTRKITRAAPA